MNFGNNLPPSYTLVLAADDKVHLSINKNTLNQDHSCRKDTTDRRLARKELRSRTVKTMQLPCKLLFTSAQRKLMSLRRSLLAGHRLYK